MKRFFIKFLFVFFLVEKLSFAANLDQLPNISGDILFIAQGDRVVSTQKKGVSANNAMFYAEADLSLNLNKNWSIKTDWRLQQNSILTTRNDVYPERYRSFLQERRGVHPQDTGLIVEELKLDFENEDLNFQVGKFDPGFGTAHNRSKRMGIYTWQVTEDYNLREKLGAGMAALLENSKVSFNLFFNDTTGLSRSALDQRDRAKRDGLAGSTGTLSSYSINFEGEEFFGVDNLFYNFGYRSLGSDNIGNREREEGYLANFEYQYDIGLHSSIVPFLEIVKINNFTGEKNRDAHYTTLAVMANYSSWIASLSHITRHIKQPLRSSNVSDKILQLSAGYKINKNFTVDVTRAEVKEDGKKGSMFGVSLSYLYSF